MQIYTDEFGICQAGNAPAWLADIGHQDRGLEWQDKNYRATVRRFKNGEVEVTTSVVRAMERWQLSDRWAQGGQILPEGLTDRQTANIEAEKAHYKAWKAMLKADDLQQMTEAERESLEANTKADNLERAVRRARQQIRFHCRQLCCDHMVTLTYRDNMDDVVTLQKDWKEFVRLVRKVKPQWQFVACRERQERGALHLHIGVKGRQDIGLLRSCWYKALGGTGKEEGDNTPGQIDVRGPSKRWGAKTVDWKVAKLAGYMTKYMHKAFEELDAKGSKRYWHSKGIEKPEVEQIWLASSSFVEAIIDTHKLFRAQGVRIASLWASEGYDCVWFAG